MSIHAEAIKTLKAEIDRYVREIMDIETKITTLIQHKEEFNALASNLSESIKVLGKQDREAAVMLENEAIEQLNNLSGLELRIKNNPLPEINE